jgi:Family of unknown function (DUF6338)
MQFDLNGFLIFLGFILPGFVAQRARVSLAPKPLKPVSAVAEVGEFVLAGVLAHVTLLIAFRIFLGIFAGSYYLNVISSLQYGSRPNFVWNHSKLMSTYFLLSLVAGYAVGLIQGWQILQHPTRGWVSSHLGGFLQKVGITGFLQEEPVWYFVFKQASLTETVFLEVEMKNGAGFYTGKLRSYGILDDCEKSKDFYIEEAHYKSSRSANYSALNCDGLLLNFEDVISIQIRKVEPLLITE